MSELKRVLKLKDCIRYEVKPDRMQIIIKCGTPYRSELAARIDSLPWIDCGETMSVNEYLTDLQKRLKKKYKDFKITIAV